MEIPFNTAIYRQMKAEGRLVAPVPGAASTGRGYYLCRRRALGPHLAAEVFSDWVVEQAKETEG